MPAFTLPVKVCAGWQMQFSCSITEDWHRDKRMAVVNYGMPTVELDPAQQIISANHAQELHFGSTPHTASNLV